MSHLTIDKKRVLILPNESQLGGLLSTEVNNSGRTIHEVSTGLTKLNLGDWPFLSPVEGEALEDIELTSRH